MSRGHTGTIVCMLLRRNFRILLVTVAVLVVAGLSLSAQESNRRGRKYKPPPPTARIEVTIVRDVDEKPIENAAVIFHLDGDKGNMELKTNEDGKSIIDVLPIGSTMRLQVIAKGFQTYGEDYKIDKPEMTLGVRMKRPGEQYSIYKNHNQASDGAKPSDKDAGKEKDSKDPAKDKPAESENKAGTQPASNQPQPE